MPSLKHPGTAAVLLGTMLALAGSLAAQLYPTRPMEGEFVIDEAGLLRPEDRAQIKQVCAALLKERGVPIIVVTTPSLSRYGATNIEYHARGMFDTWGIGARQGSRGILLLVAVEDRKARIELGEGYAHTKDDIAREIMQDAIVPSFKRGNYSAGILQGVQALDQMAREERRRTGAAWEPWLFLGLLGLGVGVAISLIRSGRSGWGWGLLAIIFAIVVGMLLSAGRGSGSGTSFGGGRGGGGGATGSW